MRIHLFPDPVLERRADAVAPDLAGLREMVSEMLETMKEAQGVGLAAPQVGESLRLFVASESGDPDEAIVCINPRIEPFGPIVELEEGCLSVPGIREPIQRPEGVRITYRDLDGHEKKAEFHELMARIVQHEYDHLDGILFIEHMSEAQRLRVRPDLEALAEQYRP